MGAEVLAKSAWCAVFEQGRDEILHDRTLGQVDAHGDAADIVRAVAIGHRVCVRVDGGRARMH